MTSTMIPAYIAMLVAFVPSIVLHEMGHAFAAYKLGDPTASKAGRLSFNPLRHIDPFGTVLLPVMLAFLNMPVFGYAKPVPYNPRYFKDPRKGDLIVGLAGPGCNLLQALVATIVAAAIYFGLSATGGDPTYFAGGLHLYMLRAGFDAVWFVGFLLGYYIYVNLILMIFNLIPIPPLDGSSIFAFILPEKYLPQYYRVQQYAMPVLMIILIVLPYVFRINPFGVFLDITAGNLFNLLTMFAG